MLGVALLAPPPSLAAPERGGDSHSYQSGGTGSAPVAVAPNSTKRSAEGTVPVVGVRVAPKATTSPTPARRIVHAGREAPALMRWRIAHGTATASP